MIQLTSVNIEFDNDAVVSVRNIILGKYVEYRWNYVTITNVMDSITPFRIVVL
jgi:hypothetical protein